MTFTDNIKWPSTSPRRSQIHISESILPKQNRIFPHPLNLLATRFPICNTGPRPPHTRVRRFCGTCAMSLSLTPHAPLSPQLLLRTQYVQRKYPLPLPLRELHGSLTFEWKYTAFIAREVRVSAEKPKNWTSDQSTSKSVFAAVRVQGMWT